MAQSRRGGFGEILARLAESHLRLKSPVSPSDPPLRAFLFVPFCSDRAHPIRTLRRHAAAGVQQGACGPFNPAIAGSPSETAASSVPLLSNLFFALLVCKRCLLIRRHVLR
eukprot:3427128-Pleurochrysis_carterae.AAC.1